MLYCQIIKRNKILKQCLILFQELSGDSSFLVWDKDDEASMDFVTACANLRAKVFSIPQKSRFDVKGFFFLIIISSL